MSEEKTTAEVIIEDNEDKEYTTLIKKFETPEKTKSGTKEKKGHIKALIFSLLGVIVLIGIACVLMFLTNGEESDLKADEASITAKADENNMWQADVETDSNGNIKKNGQGNLLEYIPSQIKTIKVENKGGSFTVKSHTPTQKTTDPETGEEKTSTESTVYKIVGFEDFELQTGIPDEVANACSALSFSTVIEANGKDNLADYGLDKPKSIVTITYTDNKKAVISVGNEAPQGVGTYIKFGSEDTVYLCETESVAPLLYKLNKFISLTINDSATNTENSDFKYINLTGSAYGKKITLKQNGYSESISNTYVLTAPEKAYADDSEGANVAGAVRGLYADSVVCVKPSASQLSKYGLSEEYAHIYGKYPDTTVDLIASKPDGKGNCYLIKKGGNVVYKIASASIPWVTTCYEDLASDYVLNPKYIGLTGVEVTANSKTYKFKVKTTVTTTTDDNGSTTSSTTTTPKYKGQELTQAYFETFFRNMALLTRSDSEQDNVNGTPVYKVKYTYSDKNKSADTVCFYKGNGNQYIATLNSKAVGHIYSTYIDKLIDQVPNVASDKEVKSLV